MDVRKIANAQGKGEDCFNAEDAEVARSPQRHIFILFAKLRTRRAQAAEL